MNHRALVIGIGNDLRGDDAVGVLAARAFGRQHRGVEVRTVHQLTPDLAIGLGAYDVVVFVDADVEAENVRWHLLTPDAEARLRDPHHMTPDVLLALAGSLDEPRPARAIQLDIPARAFSHGAAISPVAAAGLADALEVIRSLLDEVTAAV